MIYLKTSIGVEIRREDLVITCLQSNFAAGVFTHFKRVTDFRSRERSEVRNEIDQFFKLNGLRRDGLVLGIPRSDVVVRYLDLPAEVADNLRQVVLYQVQSFEPTEEEKFYFDYIPLKAAPEAKRLSVLLVLVKRSLLDRHLEVLAELGIRPSAVMLGSVALANLFLRSGKEFGGKTFILADLSPNGIEISAVKDGSLVFSREESRPETIPWREFLMQELEAAAARMRMGPEDTIEKVVLCGEEGENVQREVHEALPDCELLASRVQLEMPLENQARIQGASVSLGLALSGLVHRPPLKLNLLPQNLRIQQNRWSFVPTVILGVSVLILLGALGFRQLVQQRILLRQLDQEIAALRVPVNRVQALRAEAEAVEKQILFVEGILRQRDMNLEVLQELTNILPADTFLNVYMNQRGSFQLSGASSAPSDLMPKLERSPLLMKVEQTGTVYRDAQTGKDRFNFSAKLEKKQ